MISPALQIIAEARTKITKSARIIVRTSAIGLGVFASTAFWNGQTRAIPEECKRDRLKHDPGQVKGGGYKNRGEEDLNEPTEFGAVHDCFFMTHSSPFDIRCHDPGSVPRQEAPGNGLGDPDARTRRIDLPTFLDVLPFRRERASPNNFRYGGGSD